VLLALYLERLKPKDGQYRISEKMIRNLHIRVTKGVPGENNIPGKYRNGKVEVGDKAHGGIYKPPHIIDDIELLMSEFIDWINSEKVLRLNPFHRAFLAHYYFSRIHPFWDGNGRSGNTLSWSIMKH